MKKKILSLLVLLMTAVSGAWADNYYLVGTMNDWGASKQFLLTKNTENTNNVEYMITLTLKADAEFKVIGVDGENNATWYPGEGGNYKVTTAGKYTVYFRPGYDGESGWHCSCIYLDPAPAPAIPLTDAGTNQWQFTMPAYAVVAKIEYDTELELQEENVNTAVLEDWDGYEADVTLKRSLVAGSWYTLAVPFNVSSTLLGYLKTQYGMEVKELESSSLNGQSLTLNFRDAASIVAGTPYLVYVTADFDFSAQALPNTVISNELNTVPTDYADFVPTLGKTTIENVAADNVLFVASGNKLQKPNDIPAYMKGFRAYFLLKNVPANQVRSFALNLGDDETGISATLNDSGQMTNDNVYDLQGRKVNAAQKGVYIMNGKKVIK